ncbi:DUF748 domain-containing protein [Candidatus Methylobacter oryzae]|uniref:DUF748 domain-containing protein n=1 Tax=Candidatus Methylobacter oryzae TaxID=2497749 RepID=A0ABY3CG26_9GAMM|nr:DUF748 domain-containing protein [Candidatus Methylobacter oryzae]TRX02685.1 DUF748 domain-containing protein [Candidatus Methylobacter oryzae]
MKILHIGAKFKIAALIVGSLLGIYTMLGFYLLPTLVKSKLPALILQETGRNASVATVRFDPFSLRLNLQGFQLQERNGQLFVGFDDFFVDVNGLQSFSQKALVIDKVVLSKPVIRIARDKQGAFNFKDLFSNNNAAKQDSSKTFPLNIVKLLLAEGKLDWEDAYFTNPEQETIYPINATIENLTTLADKQLSLGLSMELKSGGKLEWQGLAGLKPMSSSGHIKLDNVKLSRIRSLALQDLVNLDLQGYEQLEADYEATYVDNKFNVNVSQGKFELHDLQVSATALDKAELNSLSAQTKLMPSGHKALVTMPKLSVQGIVFNLQNHELTIKSVAANDADFKAWLNPEGTLNYESLLPVAKTADSSDEPAQQAPWTVNIDNIVLNNGGLSFEDRTLKKPVTMTAKPIDFKLTNFSNKAGASLPFQFSTGFNKSGLIKLDGNAVVQPLSAQVAVNVEGVELENFQAYVDKFARLDVIDGKVAVSGNVSVIKSVQDKPAIKFAGNTKVVDFLTRDQVKNKDFIKWGSLALSGIDADLSANQYNAETLVIDKPYVRVVIKKDKTINFNDIMFAEPNKRETGTYKSAEPEAQKPKFRLGRIQITDGSSDFSDLSLILPFAAQVKSLDGGVSDISSERKSTIKVDLKGNAYDLAPVDVKGEINPNQGYYNVQINFTGMPMPLISSYMVQFAGYKVEKGKMSLELNYKVADRVLTASNNILIDRFELGEKVENPNAVSLPLKLAVALMKDSDGKIRMHVPITGSLEDPKFSITHLITDALVNAISRVITSPFHALASLIGSEEDLSTISFPAGSAELDKQQIGKLDDLVKALKTRSELKLEIKGAAFQEQDWPAVSDDALYDQLKRIKAAEINQQGGRKIQPEYVVISDQDYRRLMEQLFAEKFPVMVEKTLLGTLRLVGSKADTNTDEFYAVAKDKLSAIIKPEEQRLKNLAAERAQAIARYIVQKGGIPNERVFILDTAIDPIREGKEIVSLLSLKVD